MIDIQAIANKVKPNILRAGEMILKDWENHRHNIHLKNERDIVTDTDVVVEKYLKNELHKILPQAGFIVEEGKTEMQNEYNWTIDPIDGTKYFAHRAPLFYTQVSLLKDGKPVISFVYQPVSKQLFSAVKGYGSYLNEVKLTPPTSTTALEAAIIDFDMGSLKGEENIWKFEIIEKVSKKIYRPRFTGGYLSIYLVMGAIDVSINTDVNLPLSIKNSVDLHPHNLIFSESGYQEKLFEYRGKFVLIHASQQLIEKLELLLS